MHTALGEYISVYSLDSKSFANMYVSVTTTTIHSKRALAILSRTITIPTKTHSDKQDLSNVTGMGASSLL